MFKITKVFFRIAIDQDQIGRFARCNRTRFISDAQQPGAIERRNCDYFKG